MEIVLGVALAKEACFCWRGKARARARRGAERGEEERAATIRRCTVAVFTPFVCS